MKTTTRRPVLSLQRLDLILPWVGRDSSISSAAPLALCLTSLSLWQQFGLSRFTVVDRRSRLGLVCLRYIEGGTLSYCGEGVSTSESIYQTPGGTASLSLSPSTNSRQI